MRQRLRDMGILDDDCKPTTWTVTQPTPTSSEQSGGGNGEGKSDEKTEHEQDVAGQCDEALELLQKATNQLTKVFERHDGFGGTRLQTKAQETIARCLEQLQK